jgi:uncharacterized protein (TIGR02246 family)
MRPRTQWIAAALVVLGLCPALSAQKSDPEMQAFIDQYRNAWNAADAKALAAFYTPDALRIGLTGQLLVGRDAIQRGYGFTLAGPLKGTRMSVQMIYTEALTPDVRLLHGTYEVSGGAIGAQRGKFLNTLVRRGGQWLFASVAILPDPKPTR